MSSRDFVVVLFLIMFTINPILIFAAADTESGGFGELTPSEAKVREVYGVTGATIGMSMTSDRYLLIYFIESSSFTSISEIEPMDCYFFKYDDAAFFEMMNENSTTWVLILLNNGSQRVEYEYLIRIIDPPLIKAIRISLLFVVIPLIILAGLCRYGRRPTSEF